MSHVSKSRPAYNDRLSFNTEGYVEVRSQGDYIELLSVPQKTYEEGQPHIRFGWPNSNILRLFGADDSPGHCYRLIVRPIKPGDDRLLNLLVKARFYLERSPLEGVMDVVDEIDATILAGN